MPKILRHRCGNEKVSNLTTTASSITLKKIVTIMKKITFLSLAAILATVLVSVTSCDKIAQKIPDISWTQANIPITIPASSNTNLQVQFGKVDFDLNKYIQENAGVAAASFSMVKHIYVTSVTANAVANADANNNFTNLSYASGSEPVVVFNTTSDYSTATRLGGATTTPPTDPYTLNIPVTNNTDIIKHVNGKTWSYGFAYRLIKPTTKDVQVMLNVKYNLSFKD
jgi:hypothetical protein